MFLNNFIGSTLERIEASDENLGEAEQALGTFVHFMIAAQDTVCDEFTQQSSGCVDRLLVG